MRNIHVCKIYFQGHFSLNPPIRDFTYLITIEALPLFGIKLEIKLHHEVRMYEIYEGIAHIALVFEVNRKIKEVILILLVSIKVCKKHSLRVLVRDVFNHYCGSKVRILQN